MGNLRKKNGNFINFVVFGDAMKIGIDQEDIVFVESLCRKDPDLQKAYSRLRQAQRVFNKALRAHMIREAFDAAAASGDDPYRSCIDQFDVSRSTIERVRKVR